MDLQRKLAATAKANKSTVITMYPPTEADIFLFLKWLVSQEEQQRPSMEFLMSIAESSEGNFQYAKQQLEMHREGDGKGTGRTVEGTREVTGVGFSSSRRDTHATFKSIFESNQDVANILSIIDDDPWLNPLRLHENLIKEINNRKGIWKTKHIIYEKILESMIVWDQHMSISSRGGASGSDGSGISEMSGGSDAMGTDHLARTFCHFLGKLDKKKKAVDSNLQDFTKLFSQMSLHKKQEKALFHDSQDFPWADAHFF